MLKASCKSALREHLKTAWGYDDEKGVYLEGNGMMGTTVQFMPCLADMDKIQLIEVFGVPNYYDHENSTFDYFYQKHIKPGGCEVFVCVSKMVIQLTPDGHFSGMGFPTMVESTICPGYQESRAE
jgi:hypothetical protein